MEIEKGVPAPMTIGMTLRSMEIGDSVIVDRNKASSWRTMASTIGMNEGYLFRSKTLPDGVRIWREA